MTPSQSNYSEVSTKHSETRKAGHTAVLLASSVLAASGIIGFKHMANNAAQADEARLAAELKNATPVVAVAESFDNDEKLLGRVYDRIPPAVFNALKKDLDGQEVDADGNYVGLVAAEGYNLPASGNGLVLSVEYQALFEDQQAAAADADVAMQQ